MRFLRTLILSLSLFSVGSCSVLQSAGIRKISPISFGIKDAKTGEERYDVLFKTHTYAKEHGLQVDYSGLNVIELSIPKGAKSIPLTDYTDFKGATFILHNYSKTIYAFELVQQKPSEIQVSAENIDRGLFRNYKSLSNGRKVLVIKDKNPWVEERKGYGQPMIRNDILYIENGIAVNSVVFPYNNKASVPTCEYFECKKGQRVIKNVKFYRDASSTAVPYCIKVNYANDLLIENVEVHTEPNDLSSDHALHVMNSVNVVFKDVLIDKTYSQVKLSGYGIALHNLWNCEFVNLTGYGNWGVFGSNNLSNIRFKECNINRFDIHCYGKDIYFNSCKFFNLYNQFSSMTGVVYFEDCEFENFTPVLIESSYNAFTPFTIEMKNCVFNTTASKNYLIEAGRFDEDVNSRPELAKRYWPKLIVNNLTVNCPSDVKSFCFYRGRVPDESGVHIDHIDDVAVDGLIINNEKGQKVSLYLSKYKVKTRTQGAMAIEGVRFAGDTKAASASAHNIIGNITRTK